MAISDMFKNMGKGFAEWVKPDAPGPVSATTAAAMMLTDRNQFSALLNYRDVDDSSGIIFLDDGVQPSAGFMLSLNPLLVAGQAAENQIESIINTCPADTILQFGVLSTPQIQSFVDMWTEARLKDNNNEFLQQIALWRREFMLRTAIGPSMLPKTRMHPRMMQHFMSVRVPFKGNPEDSYELDSFLKDVLDLRNTIQGALAGCFIQTSNMSGDNMKYLLRELLNPHLDPHERIKESAAGVPMHLDLVDRNTRVTITKDGYVGFSGSSTQGEEVVVTPITVDSYPQHVFLPLTATTLGAPSSWDDRIACPFWAYTVIHVLDADAARDSLITKLGLLNKQCMSESQWYRSMMSFLYVRRDATDLLLTQTRVGHRLCRVYSGINLYNPARDVRNQLEYVKGLWRRAGFRASEEKHIALPVFLASLPMQYSPEMDPPNKGLQRAVIAHSLNAASLAFVQGDWPGNGAAEGGPLLVSRRGQLAAFNLFNSNTNYNFVVVAASGSGKSFFTNELAIDFLSKGGIVRLIDVGRSYWRFCELMGGRNMVFSPDKPQSLNPFWDINTQTELAELMPMVKEMLLQMAYPLGIEDLDKGWEYTAIEKAIEGAWQQYGGKMDLSHVHDWLEVHGDARAKDLAFQLSPYAKGRYSAWFNGPREMGFDNDLVVIELEELKADKDLSAVVMALVISQITREMYLADRKIPKMLAIDEAWDLLGGGKSGKFIETAFRRARKYNGCAGVITQSFSDFDKSEAAKAALENSAWQFVLHQLPESIDSAVRSGKLQNDPNLIEMLKTVNSGMGFSEVYVRCENGSGIYRFVSDRHSYYVFTSRATDIAKMRDLQNQGMSLAEAIDTLARKDYDELWGRGWESIEIDY